MSSTAATESPIKGEEVVDASTATEQPQTPQQTEDKEVGATEKESEGPEVEQTEKEPVSEEKEPEKEPQTAVVTQAGVEGTAVVPSTETEAEAEADAVDPAKAAAELESARLLFQEKARAYLTEQQQHVVIPSYSAWFDISKIHSIEKKLFPDFFPPKGSSEEFKSVYKTVEVYTNVRNFMINAYRINPLEYLTVTAARRNLAGDVTSIIRIHHFLEKWGLINYQIDPRTKPSTVGPQFTGHFQVTLDTPTGLVPFLPELPKDAVETKQAPAQDSIPAISNANETAVVKTEIDSIPLNLEARRNIYTKNSDLSKRISSNATSFFCNVCGQECTKTRYHNLKVKAYTNNPNSTNNNASIVCVSCFEQGLFPLNFYSSDFIKLKEESEVSEFWTEQETLLLLEGIEIYGSYDSSANGANQSSNNDGQWDKIADHIGTKSREECLIKFIQLPIEDRYLTKLASANSANFITKTSDIRKPDGIASDVLLEIVNKPNGASNISSLASSKVNSVNDQQLSLINQVIELTLEKVSLKLSNIDLLEKNLIAKEKSLEQERKQVYYERWAQYEKILRFKSAHPELTQLLDDLATPIKLQEVAKSKMVTEAQDDNGEDHNENLMEIEEEQQPSTTPLSVSNPKSYQFWSG